MPTRKSHFTEEQIAQAPTQAETGTLVTEISLTMGASGQSYYRWKKSYGGLVVHEIRGSGCRKRTADSSSWSRIFRSTS